MCMLRLKKILVVLSSCILLVLLGACISCAKNVKLHEEFCNEEKAPGYSRAPIVVVPQSYFGTVEVYRTPNGYMVRTRQEENDTYENIHRALERTKNIPND